MVAKAISSSGSAFMLHFLYLILFAAHRDWPFTIFSGPSSEYSACPFFLRGIRNLNKNRFSWGGVVVYAMQGVLHNYPALIGPGPSGALIATGFSFLNAPANPGKIWLKAETAQSGSCTQSACKGLSADIAKHFMQLPPIQGLVSLWLLSKLTAMA